MTVRIRSVNVGEIVRIAWRGKVYETAFVKRSVTARVRVEAHGIEGDRQADLSVHGGPLKAVYAYAWEHYAWWRGRLGEDLEPGAFGENLTLEGLLERDVRIGDIVTAGTVRMRVTQPRSPCVKMSAVFGRSDMPRLFLRAARPGFYLAVESPGWFGAGDRIEHETSMARPSLLGDGHAAREAVEP